MLQKFFFSVTALILLFILGGLLIPNDYEIRQEIVINAPVSAIEPHISDLKAWKAWTPWEAQDPTIKTLIKQAKGVGASQSWKGDSGDGRLIFTHVDPKKGVDFDLFFNQNSYQCQSGLRYEPIDASHTKITWYMKGKVTTPIVGGYVAWLTESMGSSAFDKGLKKLKNLVENPQR